MRPRIRSIKPEMWADERVGALSRDARLLLLGLITMADDEGRFRARRPAIHGHVFPADEDALAMLGDWLKEIDEQGMVLFYEVSGVPYGAFRHWREHQKINRATASTLPPPPDPTVIRRNRVSTPGMHGAVDETSVSNDGNRRDQSRTSHSSTRRRAFRSDPIRSLSEVEEHPREAGLCVRLAEHIRNNDPKAKPRPESDAWVRDMRLLVAERGGNEDAVREVERIIDWCQADPFWRSNILSPSKLRKQFVQLALKAGLQVRGNPRQLPRTSQHAEHLRTELAKRFENEEEVAA